MRRAIRIQEHVSHEALGRSSARCLAVEPQRLVSAAREVEHLAEVGVLLLSTIGPENPRNVIEAAVDGSRSEPKASERAHPRRASRAKETWKAIR